MAVVLLGGILGQRSADRLIADPAFAAASRAALARGVADANRVLGRLRDSLEGALGEGRTAASLVVAGSEAPGPHLRAAVEALQGGDELVGSARAAMARIEGELATLRPGTGTPTLAIAPGQVGAAAARLASAAGPADAFAAMRQATQATLANLGAALAALDRGAPSDALDALDRADGGLAAVRAWPGQLATLPIWVRTTGQLLAAARGVAVATRDGDAAARETASRAYQAAAADAHQADLALEIAISEGGAAVTGAALAATADLLSAVNDALDRLATLATDGG